MVSSEQEVFSGLVEIIRDVAGDPDQPVAPESTLDDLDLDSLALVEVAMGVVETFGVEIPDENLGELKTVQDVVDYIALSAARV